MTQHTPFFEALWQQYTDKTPSASKIKSLFETHGNTVLNDHIAIRTFDHPSTDISIMAQPFIAMGYEEKGSYHFQAKKLDAKHYEHATNPQAPKIFISQLLTAQFSTDLQQTVQEIIAQASSKLAAKDLVLQGRIWDTPSYAMYQQLLAESEYAAWLYVNGFCSNHFTVNVNALAQFDSLKAVNDFLIANGYAMNTAGGLIKGSPAQYLEQSSILADKVAVTFQEATHEITSCYYEFAYRYAQENGKLFTGFITNSADKIFESTDMHPHKPSGN